MIINGYTVTSSNASASQTAGVRVKLGGHILADVKTGRRSNALHYIQRNIDAPERAKLIAQLTKAGVPDSDVQALLKPRPSAYEFQRLMRTA